MSPTPPPPELPLGVFRPWPLGALFIPPFQSFATSSNPVIFLPELLAEGRLVINNRSENKIKVAWRLDDEEEVERRGWEEGVEGSAGGPDEGRSSTSSDER